MLREQIGADQQDGAHGGGPDERHRRRPPDPGHELRGGERHERDGAGGGGGERGETDRDRDGAQSHDRDRSAHLACHAVAELERCEAAPHQQQRGDQDRDGDDGRQHLRPPATVERADQPDLRGDRVVALAAGQEQIVDGAEQRADSDADEDQPVAARRPAPQRQCSDENRGEHAAADGGERHDSRRRLEDEDRHDGAGGRTGHEPDDVG